MKPTGLQDRYTVVKQLKNMLYIINITKIAMNLRKQKKRHAERSFKKLYIINKSIKKYSQSQVALFEQIL